MLSNVPTIDAIVNCEWHSDQALRRLTLATKQDGKWLITSPEPVGDPSTLLGRVRERVGNESRLLVGLAFPIGVPLAYARRVGISNFRDWAVQLGNGAWRRFFKMNQSLSELNFHQPIGSGCLGEQGFPQMLRRLGIAEWQDAWRLCDPKYGTVGTERCLFWPVCPQSAGRSVISGWRDLLIPRIATGNPGIGLWHKGCVPSLDRLE
jgi:hypothetical protein